VASRPLEVEHQAGEFGDADATAPEGVTDLVVLTIDALKVAG